MGAKGSTFINGQCQNGLNIKNRPNDRRHNAWLYSPILKTPQIVHPLRTTLRPQIILQRTGKQPGRQKRRIQDQMVHRLIENHCQRCGNRSIKWILSSQKNRHWNDHRKIPSESFSPERNHSKRFRTNKGRVHFHLRKGEIEQWTKHPISLYLHPPKSERSLPVARLPRRAQTL